MLFEDLGIKYEILGTDMQLEGITKNQSFGLDEHDKPAEEILQKIMHLANPDGKLVYVIKPKAPGGPEMLFITTRAAAGEARRQTSARTGSRSGQTDTDEEEVVVKPFAVSCTTCRARLKVLDPSAIGQILSLSEMQQHGSNRAAAGLDAGRRWRSCGGRLFDWRFSIGIGAAGARRN